VRFAAFLLSILFVGCFRTPLDELRKSGDASNPLVPLADAGTRQSDTVAATEIEPPDRTDAKSALPDVANAEPVAAPTSCTIGGVQYDDGAANPQNDCESCQLSLTASSWSSIAVVPGCLAAGWAHSCAVSNGGAWCWGYNNEGQLGNGTKTDSHIPIQVNGLSSGVSGIAAGFNHSCAVVKDAVQCWGLNQVGQLGNGSTTNSTTPIRVKGLPTEIQVLVAGENHTCVIASGEVWCWGSNDRAQIGITSSIYSLVPVRVPGLPPGVHGIAAGTYHTCALAGDAVWCWGDDSYNQLGHVFPAWTLESAIPVQVDGLLESGQGIAATEWGTYVLTSRQSVQCWGGSISGSLFGAGASNPVTTIEGFGSDPSFVVARMEHACAIVGSSRHISCWGDNFYGDLGSPSAQQGVQPFEVSSNLIGVQAIAAGDYHTCALMTGEIWCWGHNQNGQLGNGLTADSSTPVQVLGLPP
jgi:alpha-tubulin suppressor-like RCC1 family protein